MTGDPEEATTPPTGEAQRSPTDERDLRPQMPSPPRHWRPPSGAPLPPPPCDRHTCSHCDDRTAHILQAWDDSANRVLADMATLGFLLFVAIGVVCVVSGIGMLSNQESAGWLS